MKSLRDIRVIPVVLIAVAGLAVLKVAGLVIDGGYVFDYQPDSTKSSWAPESLNFPRGGRHRWLGREEGGAQARGKGAGSGEDRRPRGLPRPGPAGAGLGARDPRSA